MSTERDNLEIHVDLCQERYRRLEERMDRIEARVENLSSCINQFHVEINQRLDDLKQMLFSAKDERFKTMVTTTGSIIVALIAVIGYIAQHIK